MERYSMFLGRKNQYCENDYTTKCNLQFQCNPYQVTNGIFHRTRTKNFTILETQKTLNSQSNLDLEEWTWRNQLTWFWTILQSYSHQDSMVLADQWNKTESPETNPCTCGHLTFDKGKNLQWRKDNLSNKWCWENWPTTCKRMKLEHFLTPCTKINSKWIEDLNVRPETIKLLEENVGKTLSDINHSRILCDPPPRVMEIKAKINKWGLIKLKTFAQWRKL